VDEDEDIMCFLTTESVDDLGAFKVVLPSPSCLKPNSFLYDSIDERRIRNVEKSFLTIAFRSEIFAPTTDLDDEGVYAEKAAKQHFFEALLNLQSYSSYPFERFYWTSSATHAFFESITGQAPHDEARAQQWMQLAAIFDALIDGGDDVCQFESLIESTMFFPVR
jgi:hypothetical protein